MNHIDTHVRVLWLLHTDATVRSNILIDDARSVQQLCLKHISDNKALASALETTDDESARTWSLEKIDEPTFAIRDQALIDIFKLLQNSINTIEKSMSHVSDLFCAATYPSDKFDPKNKSASDAIAKFVLHRGRLISAASDHFLVSLQIAREKFQQILENKPGALPAPQAQRRWANSSYVDFLDIFSRRARKQVVLLADHMKGNGITSDRLCQIDKELAETEMSFHGIGYASTSWTNVFRFRQSDGPYTRQIVTKSSYFYPEQPTLLPLLHHEYAHHYQQLPKSITGSDEGFDALFEKASVQLTKAFVRSPLFSDRTNQASQYCESLLAEIKADVFALSISGNDYLHALFLQICGLEHEWLLLHRTSQNGDELPDVIEYRASPINLDNQSAVLCIARLLFCLEFLQERATHIGPALCKTEKAFSDELRSFCVAYIGSLRRLELNEPTLASANSDEYLSEIEKYFQSTVQIGTALTALAREVVASCGKELSAGSNYCRGHLLNPKKTIDALDKTVADYCAKTLGAILCVPLADMEEFRLRKGEAHEVNAISSPFMVRWYVSGWIVAGLRKNNGISREDFRSKICDSFSKYFRNDGSVAFRYLLEYISARRHIFKERAENRTDPKRCIDEFEKYVLGLLNTHPELTYRLANAINKKEDSQGNLADFVAENLPALIKAWVGSELQEEITLDNRKTTHHCLPWEVRCTDSNILVELDEHLARPLHKALEEKKGSVSDTPLGCPVGMLDLGTISPYYRDVENSNPEWNNPQKTYVKFGAQFESSVRVLNEKLNKDLPAGKHPFVSTNCRLIGEYSYASIIFGTTPVERDMYCGQPLPQLQKPRFVLAVGESNFGNIWDPTSIERKIHAITLVKFPYRHHWIRLKNYFKTAHRPKILLSTAWETAIVLWEAESSDDFWKTALELNRRADTHTSIVSKPQPNKDFLNGIGASEGFEKLILAANDKKISEPLNFRTGRYDYATVVKNVDQNSILALIDHLSEVAWKNIEKLSIEARVTVCEAGCDGKLMPEDTKGNSFEWMVRKMDRHSTSKR
jgi:hypothetical protein